MFQFGISFPNHYRFMFMSPFKLEHEPSAAGEQAYGAFLDAATQAIEGGRFRPADPNLVAQVLWSSVHGAVALLTTFGAERFPHSPASPHLIEAVIEAGIRGFLTSA